MSTIALPNAGLGSASAANALTSSLNINVGSNRFIVVFLQTFKSNAEPPAIAGNVTFNGIAMTLAKTESWYDGAAFYKYGRVWVYYLLHASQPGSGTNYPIVANFASNFDLGFLSSFQMANVHQTALGEFIFKRANDSVGPLAGRVYNTAAGDMYVGNALTVENPTGVNGYTAISGVSGISGVTAESIGFMPSPYTGSHSYDFQAIYYEAVTTPTDFSISWLNSSTGLAAIADAFIYVFNLHNSDYTPLVAGVDPDNMCPYVSAGQVRKMVNTITGLDHLEGETIKVQVDGILPEGDNAFEVSGGSITLPNKAAVAHAGLGYEGTIQLLKQSDGSQIGTGQGKMRRIFDVVLRLYRSLGLKVGPDEDHLKKISPGVAALPLITGDVHKAPEATWNNETELIIKQDLPLPAHILAVILKSEVEEKG